MKGIRSAMRIGIQQMMRRWVKGLGSTHTSIRWSGWDSGCLVGWGVTLPSFLQYMVVPKFEVRLGLRGLDVWMEFEDQSYEYLNTIPLEQACPWLQLETPHNKMHHSAYHMQKVKEKLGTSWDSEVIFLLSTCLPYQIGEIFFWKFPTIVFQPIVTSPGHGSDLARGADEALFHLSFCPCRYLGGAQQLDSRKGGWKEIHSQMTCNLLSRVGWNQRDFLVDLEWLKRCVLLVSPL